MQKTVVIFGVPLMVPQNINNLASSNSQLCSSNLKPEASRNFGSLRKTCFLFPFEMLESQVLKVGGRVSISDVLSTLAPMGSLRDPSLDIP